jgi:hypothetical protein
MANVNAVVDSVSSLSSSLAEVQEARRARPAARTVTVNFGGGQSGLLDLTQPRSLVWAEVLHSMREASQPAYVEIDPATRFITQLLVPLVVRVGEIKQIPSGAEVELIISHARHFLENTLPGFAGLMDALRTAQRQKSTVVVTETDDHKIIDVRPADIRPAAKPQATKKK